MDPVSIDPSAVLRLLQESGLDDVIVVGGGIIPREDISTLEEMGVAAVFGPGAPLTEIVHTLQNLAESVG